MFGAADGEMKNEFLCLFVDMAMLSFSPWALARPLIVAHRGAADLTMPEASLPAYSNAVAGASDIVKLDLQRTKDGVIVMGHDPSLKRVMGWDAKIEDLTYAEILEKGRFLPAGGFTDERIVRLDQALVVVRSVPAFWIDFKHFDPVFVEAVLAEFKKAGIDEQRLMVATFNIAALAYFQQHHPGIFRIGHISFSRRQGRVWKCSCGGGKTFATKAEVMESICAYCDRYGLYGVNMPVLEDQTTAADVRRLKERGLWVSLWFVQTKKKAERCGKLCADAYVSDHSSQILY